MKKSLIALSVLALFLVLIGCSSTYTITLVNDGVSKSVECTGDYTLPTETKEHYTFEGYTDSKGNVITTVTKADKGLTFYAKFTENQKYTITYNLDGGVLPEGAPTEFYINEGCALVSPAKEGYTFLGWSLAEGSTTYVSEIAASYNQNAVLYANYSKDLVTYTVVLVLNDGEVAQNVTSFTEGDTVELPTPTKAHAEFLGWSFAETGTTYVTKLNTLIVNNNLDYVSDNTITIYAQWKAIYDVKYELDGGVLEESEMLTRYAEGEAYNLTTPYKQNYTFLGWSVTEGGTKYIKSLNKLTFKSNMSYFKDSTITLYANWQEVEVGTNYTITYNCNGGCFTQTTIQSIIDAFTADYKTYAGASGPNNWAESHNFKALFYDIKKWQWLCDYFAAMNTNSYNGHTNASEILMMKNTGSCDWGYYLSVECYAFVKQGTSSVCSGELKSADYGTDDAQAAIWKYYNESEQNVYKNNSGIVTLKTPVRPGYKFAGWYDNASFKGLPLTEARNTCTLYAKWTEEYPVTAINVANPTDTLELYIPYQLEWSVEPSNANIPYVTFKSSDNNVASVSDTGLITTKKEGTCTIYIISKSLSAVTYEMPVTVIRPDHFDISYETNSYGRVGETLQLNAKYIKSDYSESRITWSSLNPDIATVDKNGLVTLLSVGYASIRATEDGGDYIDFFVTVLNDTLSDAIQFVVNEHNSNAVTVYNLGIGAGTPVYYCDIIGSVSNILYNEDLTIDTTYKAAQDANTSNHGAAMSSVEFITVHYTGNMVATADGDNNAQYFATNSSVSIHYVTGTLNSESYRAFYCLDTTYGGFHASDSSQGEAVWMDTGIKVPEDGDVTPEIGISENSKYTINGQETIISIPERDDGIKVTGLTFEKNGKTYNSINKLGLYWRIKDGYYQLDKTWWGYQAEEKTLCSIGGNRNSVGIESAVDEGSDLYHTWQTTAQLVARLMVEFDLDITRVGGHQKYSGKDCPQPMLANDCELWYKFIDLVEAEYEKLTKFENTEFKMTIVSGQEVAKGCKGTEKAAGITGRLIQDDEAHVVTYKVEVNGEEIILGTAVNSIFNDYSNPTNLSIQKKGEELA